MAPRPVRIAVDIGGTFTDLQILSATTGSIHDFKSPSTPDDPARGLITALKGAAERFDFTLGDITMLLHGSTIATNAVLERKLPKAALITTAGFTDVLEIGRHMRFDVYALKAEPRSLLIPRERRFGVRERTRADGTIETPLDEEAFYEIARRLPGDGITAVAISFLHAYRNPKNEQRAAEIINAVAGLSVATSFETSPEIREFERTSTTVLNALLKPVISNYLDRLEGEMRSAGVTAPLYLVQSNGGVAAPAEAARLPVKLLLSGPAGGAMAMAGLARSHGLDNLVGVDMGGTSSDVSVVRGGIANETAESTIDGLPVRVPMIEIRTIGAGGGSIARTESGGLRVGPESAGSMPGPACYRRGGERATVTDANLALGRISADAFLGGDMTLDVQAAEDVIGRVAKDLSIAPEAAAGGIVAVANASMAGAVRLSLFEKGADPSDFTLVPFGGAGGLHACAIARELEMDAILFPATASTLSARGILLSDLRHDFLRSELFLAEAGSADHLSPIIADLHRLGQERLDADRIPPGRREITFAADCRYRGQAYEIRTPWPLDPDAPTVAPEQTADLAAAFHKLHLERYAHNAPDDPVEIVTVRASARGRFEDAASAVSAPRVEMTASSNADQTVRSRRIHLEDGWHDVPVHRREALRPDAVISGPALIEEDYATLLIEPGWQLSPLTDSSLLARRT